MRELVERACEQVERVVLGRRADASERPRAERVMAAEAGALRTLLGLVAGGRAALRLAREGGHAFVSARCART